MATLLWLLVTLAAPATSATVPILPLAATSPAAEVATMHVWVGPEPGARLEQVLAGHLPFRTLPHGSLLPLGSGRTAWLHLRLRALHPPEQGNWTLAFPLPVLDAVTVWQRDAHGRWQAQSAGDTVPIDRWPQAGRYPAFRLQPLEPGQVADVYAQVLHATPITLPVRVVTEARHEQRAQLEYLTLGMAFGALTLLMGLSVVRSWRLRDSAYGWYAIYAALGMLALAAFTGVAGHLVWGGSGAWTDAAPGCLALLAGSVAMLVTGHLSGVTTRRRRLGRAVQLVGWGGFLAPPLYLFLARGAGIVLLGGYLLAVAVLSLWAATLTWRRGDPVGVWMLAGAVPLAASVLVALARVFSWIEASWITEYALVLALTVNLPTLFGALNNRSRERRAVLLRQEAASSQDALTGLLKAQPFYAHLNQAIARFHKRGESAAVAMIELANYGWIKSSRGAEAAEEALLRAVIKLRHLVRDVDVTGRLGEARFGLILEGVSSRDVVAQRATRLIASGLMEDPERPQDVVLQFRIVAGLLSEHAPGSTSELLLALERSLNRMHPRTRRPFRMLETTDGGHPPSSQPAESQPAALGPEAQALSGSVSWGGADAPLRPPAPRGASEATEAAPTERLLQLRPAPQPPRG